MDQDGVYKLAIVGGGPAGVGVLVRAARLGYLPQLLSPAASKGVVLIHGGPVDNLGCGNLGEYIINSNTFAKSLVSSVLEEKPDLDPPESIHGTFLEELTQHAAAKRLVDAGNASIGLPELGKFLAALGSLARLEMLKYGATSTCLVNTMAVSVARVGEHCEITIKSVGGGDERVILADRVLLATGGHQAMPPELSNYRSKAFLSDYVLRESGRSELSAVLAKAKEKKVCIVGGSHSAFSVAWVLLHKMQKEDAFGPKDITMLHRGPIRCYYATKKEAEADGVVVEKTDKCGSVNTFTGLREDAKALYHAITAGREPRVRLFQLKKQPCAVQTHAYEAATAIVWCCGYGTNTIPVTANGAELPLRRNGNGGALELDLKGHLMLSTGESIPWLLGIGVGFSLRAAFDEMRSETRADGVTVYHRRGATLVLAAVFGTQIYGTDCTTFEQMVEKCERRRKEERAPIQAASSSNKESSKGPASTTREPSIVKRLSSAKLTDEPSYPPASTPTRIRLKPPEKALASQTKSRQLSLRVKPASKECEDAAPSIVRSLVATRQDDGKAMRRRTSLDDHALHLKIEPRSATSQAIGAQSCGKPKAVAGGAKDAIQRIRLERCSRVNGRPNQEDGVTAIPVVEL
ncbi:hypothetical protein LEN26_009024 [Aphanomyces euteiches]|nr:hypothetical protein LEN26_009024 [Aphanomyces euteiches]